MRKKKNETLAKVARQAGVSIATVSRVIHKDPKVKPVTYEKVVKVLKDCGYRFSSPALKSNLVAVIYEGEVDFADNFYVLSLQNYCERYLSESGFQTIYISVERLDSLNTLGLKGIISTVFSAAKFAKILSHTMEIPIIALNLKQPEEAHDNVVFVQSDHVQSIALGLQYLHNMGHRQIAYITNVSNRNSLGLERKECFLRIQAETGMSRQPTEDVFKSCDTNSFAAVSAIMATGKYTAILLSGENFTLPVQHNLHQLNLRIPEDISLLSFEVPHVSEYLYPPMTSIAQPLEEMVQVAVKYLLGKLTDADFQVEDVVLPNRILFRASIRNLRDES